MLVLPQRLKGLFRHETDGKVILANLETGWISQASPILLDFLSLCESADLDETRQYLKERHPAASVDHFLRRVELYTQHLFGTGEQTGKSQRTFTLSEWRSRPKQTITVLTLNLTHQCNLRCDYCFEGIDFRQDHGVMPVETALQALTFFLKQLGSEPGKIIFTGGEPLLNFGAIKAVMEHVTQSGAQITYLIKTNATLLTAEVRRYLVAHGCHFQVSLDGPPEVHNHHRKDAAGRGSFDQTAGNLAQLLQETGGHRVRIRGTVTHQTIDKMRSSYDYLRTFGAEGASIKTVMSESPNTALSQTDLDIFAQEVFRQAEKAAATDRNRQYEEIGRIDGICGIGLWNVTADVDGTIYPCYRLSGMPQYRMGHVSEGVTLPLPADLEALYSWDNPAGCGACSKKVLCSRGCYADKLLSTAARCDNSERIAGERVIKINFMKEDVVSVLPTL